MSNKGDGFGVVSINNKNYEVIKIGASLIKRRYDILDENGCTILKIKCSTGSNILNIFNQLTSNVESIKIFNESNINININKNTTLPNLNVDNNSTNQYTTWTLPNGNYKVFIKGEFSIKDSKCEILKVKLQDNLTTGYKMFYNCNIVKANLDYGIKIPDLMTNTESMFENSNIDHTAEINLLTTTRCSAMYKNCTNLKKIHINYIEAFNNENVLCPNLSESDYDECFFGCGNIRCGNLNSDTNNKPAIFSWANIPYSWGGLEHFNTFEIEANDANGLTLTLAKHINNDGITEASIRTDWGDGIIDSGLSHTYDKSGTYIVKTRLQSSSSSSENHNITKCLNIRNDITNMKNFFRNFKALTKCCNIPDGITDTSYAFYTCSSFNQEINIPNGVTNIEYMFYGCANFNQPVVIPESIIEMESLFYNCSSFNQTVTIPNNVENINFVFNGCSTLNQPITIGSNVIYMRETFMSCSNFNQSVIIPNRVKNMDRAFTRCVKFNQPIDIPDSVENINDIFSYCTNFNQPVNLGNSIKYMYNAFNSCTAFNQPVVIPDTVTNISEAFYKCSSFNQKIIIPNSVKNCSRMFYECTSLTSIASNWNNEYTNTIDSENCYSGCTAIQYIDDEYIISEWTPLGEGLDEVPLDWGGNGYNKEITSVFKISITSENTGVSPISSTHHLIKNNGTDRIKWGDNSYTIITDTSNSSLWNHTYSNIGDYYIKGNFRIGNGYTPSGSLKNTLIRAEQLAASAKDLTFAFTGCSKLTYVNLSNLKKSEIEKLGATFKNCNSLIEINGINSLDISNCKDISSLFYNCESLTELNISSWNTSSIVKMEGTFYNCCNLTSLESINNWNVSNVLWMNGTFENCNKLLSLNLSSWRTDSLETMPNIFENCSSLTELNITNWNTSNVTDLKYAFCGCSSLTSITGIETLNLSNAETMPYLFKECTNLQSVNLSSWNVTNVCTDIGEMFNGCNNITSINLSGWDTSNNHSLSLMFNGCNKLTAIIGFSNLDLSKVTGMHGIFKNCSSLTSITFSESFYNDNVCTDVNSAFLGCTKLESINNFNYSKHSKFMGSPDNYISSLFEECYALTTINDVCLDYTSVLGTTHGGNAVNNSYWAMLAWHIFNRLANFSLKNLTNIKFSGNVTVYDQIDSYPFLEWTWTDKFTNSTWNSFENTFPDLYLTYENPNKEVLLGTNANPPEDVLYNFGVKGWRALISSSNNIYKYGGHISSTWLLGFINGLTTASTIDISYGVTDENTIEIISNNEIMNAVSSGSHTLIYKNVEYIDSSYNYFIVNANDANGMSLTLYENPDHSGDLTLYTTNWGDGTIDNNSSHTYSSEGTYTVKTKLQSGSNALENNNIIECKNIRNDITNMEGFFCNFKALSKISSIPNGVTNMERCFKSCTTFNQTVIIPNTIQKLGYMFEGCSSFNQPLIIPEGPSSIVGILKDCTSFNKPIELPSSITDLYFAFYRCSSFNQPITIPENATNLRFSFQGCSSFNQPITIPNGVTNIGAMFRDCTSFNQSVIIPDTVQYIEQVFYGCTSLNSPITIGSNVTNMNKAFYNCSVFNQDIEVPNSVTDLTSMLENCNSYNSLVTFNLTSTSDQVLDKTFKNSSVSNVKIKGEIANDYMNRILGILVNPTTIDILELSNPNILSIIEDESIMNTINTGIGGTSHTLLWAEPTYNYFVVQPNATNGLTLTLAEHLIETFNADGTITTTPEGLAITDWGDGIINKELSHTYNEPGTYIVKTTLQPNNVNTWDPNNKEEPKDARYNKLIKKVINVRNDIDNFMAFCAGCINMEQFNIDNEIHPIDMTYMFEDCSSLISIDVTKFDITNTFSLAFLFNGCTSLNTIIGLEDLNAENVQVMLYVFTGTSITNADLSKWNCKNISMHIMGLFYGCHRLQSVDLTGWDTSNVNVIMGVFHECYELTSIKGIENWDTSKVVVMANAFSELRALKTLDLSKWNVSNVQSMYGMFEGCSSLETLGDLSNWTTPALIDAERMFNGDSKIKSLKLTNFNTSTLQKAANMFNGCTGLEEYDIVITFGNNNYMPFDTTTFDSSIKHITVKGTPDVTRMTSFINILKDQTATGAILDISQLSDEIRNNLMANTTLVDNAKAKGWII